MALTIGTSYLFDTTFFIDAFRNRGDAVALLAQAQSPDLETGYSVLTEAELWVGVRDRHLAQEHKLLLKPFQRYFVNVTIAKRAGVLQGELRRAREPIPGIVDCIIAATAEYHGFTICSRNTRHFELFSQFGISFYGYT